MPLPDNPDYDRLVDVLNPTHLDDGAILAALAAVQRLETDQGTAASYRAPRRARERKATPVSSRATVAAHAKEARHRASEAFNPCRGAVVRRPSCDVLRWRACASGCSNAD